MPPRVCRVTSRRACSTVSVLSALNCTLRSPWHQAAFRSSSGKDGMAVSRRGLRSVRPYRSSKSEAPTPTVTVSASAGRVGPRVPESAGGAVIPDSRGLPPAVRKRARSVNVRSSSVSSARFSAVASKDTNAVARRGGVRMPAWCRP